MIKQARILGVNIDIVTWAEIVKFCRQALVQAAPQMIATINGEIILSATKDLNYQKILNTADLAIADSTNVVWIGRLKGYKFPYRTPGSELFWEICEIADDLNKSIFFLGGFNGVAEISAQKVKERYPNVEIAGWSEAAPTLETAQLVRKKNPDIVFVAYGAPKQETWIANFREITTAKLLVGIGGTFDMVAERLKPAPTWLKKVNLEWLWRLYLQPSRFVRIFKAIVVFPLRAIFS